MMNETREGRTEPQELARGDATRRSGVSRVQRDTLYKNHIQEQGGRNSGNDAAHERNRIPGTVLGLRCGDWFRSQRASVRARRSPADEGGVKRIRGGDYRRKMPALKQPRKQPSVLAGLLIMILLGGLTVFSPGAAHAEGFWGNVGEKLIGAKESVIETLRGAKDAVPDVHDEVKEHLRDGSEEAWAALLSTMSQKELLRWTESMTEAAATRFDKALDAEYLRSHIGGGNHRLFDGGHTLKGAFNAVSKVCEAEQCATGEKLSGYFNSLWKDMSTPKGLPFVTLEKAQYDTFASWLTKTIPGVSREWAYDLLNYDTLEIFSAALSIVSVVYLLNQEEYELLAQTLGSTGIVSIISANPVMGIMTVAMTAYAIKTGRPIDKSGALKGAAGSGIAMALFGIMSAPFLVEMAVVMTVVTVFHKQVNADNIALMRRYMAEKWNVISGKMGEMQGRLEEAVQ